MSYESRNNSVKGTKPLKGLFVPGTLYPHATGGMEIFNFYFLKKKLEQEPGSLFYYSDHPLAHFEKGFCRYTSRKPVRFFYPFQFLRLVWTLRKSVDYGLVCFAEQSWILSWAQAAILRLFRKPYIIVVHWGKLPEWKWMPPMNYFFENAAAVVGVSEFICTEYSKVFPKARLRFIPPLIPFERHTDTIETLRRAAGIAADSKPFLFVGSLKGMKNPDVLVEAARLLGASYLEQHKICFVLAGQGPMQESLQNAVADAGLQAFFQMPGLVSREQIPGYYKMAWAYIIPSDYEGTPLSMLEAMFNGLPIIGSDATGINTIIEQEKNGMLFPVRDAAVLADRIRYFIANPDQAAAMGKAARQHYDTHFAFEQLLTRYNTLVQEAFQDTRVGIPANSQTTTP